MQQFKTRTEVIREAADKLKIVGTGQTLEDDYANRLDINLDPLLAQLARDGICNVVNTQYIPAEWFDPIAGLLGNVCASIAGAQFDPRIKEYYEMMLKKTTAGPATYNILEIDAF